MEVGPVGHKCYQRPYLNDYFFGYATQAKGVLEFVDRPDIAESIVGLLVGFYPPSVSTLNEANIFSSEDNSTNSPFKPVLLQYGWQDRYGIDTLNRKRDYIYLPIKTDAAIFYISHTAWDSFPGTCVYHVHQIPGHKFFLFHISLSRIRVRVHQSHRVRSRPRRPRSHIPSPSKHHSPAW